ncbi:DUF1642 domain-containing protein [Streptococcus suis]
MNKQEAIEKIKEHGKFYSTMFGGTVNMVPVGPIIDIVSQIDEPQKVVVPAFIDSFIRYAKTEGMSLFIAMDNAQNKESEWIITNEETFARAWLDGYEIEKEQLYVVEIPNPNVDEYSIVLGRKEGKVQIKQTLSTTWWMNCSNQLTESEIKQDFEWAWQWAKEVE